MRICQCPLMGYITRHMNSDKVVGTLLHIRPVRDLPVDHASWYNGERGRAGCAEVVPAGTHKEGELTLQDRLTFDNHCYALTASDTQGGQPVVGIAALHFIEQRDQYSRSTGSNRMAQGNGTTVDIELRAVEP